MALPNLTGRVGVITGAASGIGFALAERLVHEGMRVVLSDIEPEAVDGAVARLEDNGASVIGVVTDVTDPDAVDSLASAALNAFGEVHLVCNNAGVGGHYFPAWEAPLPYWEWVLSVSVGGVVHGIRSFVPVLLEQGEGHIVNTASVGGLLGTPFSAPYSAAKHAVVGISRSLHDELAALGTAVGVSVLCPGAVATRFSSSDRNWPPALGPKPRVSAEPHARALSETIRTNLASGTSPEEVADRVVVGVRSGRFMILTDEDLASSALDAFGSSITGGPPTAQRLFGDAVAHRKG